MADLKLETTCFEKAGLENTEQALKIAKKGDLVCATGSLFIVAESIEEVKGLSGEVYSL